MKVGVPAGFAACSKAKIGAALWLADSKRLRSVSRIVEGWLAARKPAKHCCVPVWLAGREQAEH